MWVTLGRASPARAARDHARFRTDVAHSRRADLGRRHRRPRHPAHAARLGVGRHRAAGDRAAVRAALLGPVLANWRTPTVGASLVLTVSTESLAVLAATLAVPEHAHWLLDAALAPFALGLGFYVFVISRFDLRQLVVGRGDHWITGGALAISTLAAGRITAGAKALATLGGGGGSLKDVACSCGSRRCSGCRFCWWPSWCPRGCATTYAAGRLCSPSGCTPPAASSVGAGRTRARNHQFRARVGVGGAGGVGGRAGRNAAARMLPPCRAAAAARRAGAAQRRSAPGALRTHRAEPASCGSL